MSLVVTANQQRAMDRLGSKLSEMDGKDHAAYLFLCMGILAHNAPEVVEFIMDAADRKLGGEQ